VLIATTNPGKVREIRQVLGALPIVFQSLADFPPVAEPDETGTTFAGNARLKALYYAQAFGVPVVAEDSGLEIDALDGRPGVHSARYPGATYPDKFVNLYRELQPHTRPWTARYVSAVAFVDQALGTRHSALERPSSSDLASAPSQVPSPCSGSTSAECPVPSAYTGAQVVFECAGIVEGEIAPAPRGTNGFGYDPIFFYPPYGATFGEVDDGRKLEVAHRGRAFRQFAEWLRLRLAGERQQ
jgi:XTP/dITP diphosphohydrolase